MRLPTTLVALPAVLVVLATAGCGSPPALEMEAAASSLAKATSEQADKYAAESLKAAQAAQSAMQAALKEQEGKWFKSYDRTRELAVEAKAAADKAISDAVAGREKAEAAEARAKAAAAARAKMAKEAVRVGGNIRPPVKVKDVPPVYPAVAKAAKVSGVVVLEATVGPDGRVTDTRVVRSIPLLDQAAIDAVQQWEYKPTMVKGQAVPVIVTISVNFTNP